MKKVSLNDKYRPQNYSEMISDDLIKNFLTNSILYNKISHAFLFYGGRGTGKTTLARIFAKSLNCENRRDGFEPCNYCASCVSIQQDGHPDVLEIDAASNNGVDSVRDLTEDAKYLPVQSRYKVYILDEVHMFSSSAFNALLKILEEPPEYVVFLLSTTELQKIPKTVLSRCKLLHLKSINVDSIRKRLSEICEKEDIRIDEKSFHLVAKYAKGSLRDAISLLDQMAILTRNNVYCDEVEKILGLSVDESFQSLVKFVLKADLNQSLMILDDSKNKFINFGILLEQIIDFFSILIVWMSSSNIDLEEFLSYDIGAEEIRSIAELTNPQQLNSLIEIFTHGHEILKKSVYSDDYSICRLTILRACTQNFDELKTSQFEQCKNLPINQHEIAKKVQPTIYNKTIIGKIETEKKFNHDDMIKIFNEPEMIKMVRDNERFFDYGKFEIIDNGSMPNRHLQMIVRKAREVTNNKWKIVFSDNEETKCRAEKMLDNRKDPYSDAKQDIYANNSMIKNLKKEFAIGFEDIKISK